MSRKIVNKRPVAGGRPSIRVEFGGKSQNSYYSLRKIAVEDFAVKQTQLARMVLCEWAASYNAAGKVRGKLMMEQLKLNFGTED